MNKHSRGNWFIVILLLGISIVILELSSMISMSTSLRHLMLALGVLFLITTGAAYIYQYGQATSDSDWSKDDDWSHWGGI